MSRFDGIVLSNNNDYTSRIPYSSPIYSYHPYSSLINPYYGINPYMAPSPFLFTYGFGPNFYGRGYRHYHNHYYYNDDDSFSDCESKDSSRHRRRRRNRRHRRHRR